MISEISYFVKVTPRFKQVNVIEANENLYAIAMLEPTEFSKTENEKMQLFSRALAADLSQYNQGDPSTIKLVAYKIEAAEREDMQKAEFVLRSETTNKMFHAKTKIYKGEIPYTDVKGEFLLFDLAHAPIELIPEGNEWVHIS
jgi:tricorn protease-like protein